MARQTAILLTCDYCKKPEKADDLRDVPEGWLRVIVGPVIQPARNGQHCEIDLCGERCAEKWAKERRQAKTGDDGRVTCDLCGEKLDPRGLRWHMDMHERETAA